MEAREGRAGAFRKDTVDRLLRLHFQDGRIRVNADAQLLMAELLKVFVREAAARAARQAQAEDLKKVDTDQLEKVLPQLILISDSYGNSSPEVVTLKSSLDPEKFKFPNTHKH